MSQYLLSFAKQHLEEKSDAYLIILWCLYKADISTKRYSEQIKDYLAEHGDFILKKDFQKSARRFRTVLQGKPELDWISAEGLTKLSHLQVRNFRGFGSLDKSDSGTLVNFSKVKNIFYAPNGGGKTSLCEALEFGATGHIKEADRRKTKIKQYIARGGVKHVLSLYGPKGKLIERSLQWSNCFIDRNRLQEFSLLGSKDTGSPEKDVIANLFGLEDLQTVLSKFVLPASFNLTLLRRPDEKTKISLIKSRVLVKKSEIIQQRHKLAEQNHEACEIFELPYLNVDFVRYKYNFIKKLADLKSEKVTSLKFISAPKYIKPSKISALEKIFRRQLVKKAKLEKKLLDNATSLNYRAIFEAISVIELTESELTQCPACATLLENVVENPFRKARREIDALGFLDVLSSEKNKLDQKIIKSALIVEELIMAVYENRKLGINCQIDLAPLQKMLEEYRASLDRPLAASALLQGFVDVAGLYSFEVRDYIAQCKTKLNEYLATDKAIEKLKKEILVIEAKIERFKECVSEKKSVINLIGDLNVSLNVLLKEEKSAAEGESKNAEFNDLLDAINLEYKNLHADLLNFKFDLEKSRINGIEMKAADYYQKINNHDDEHERIKSVKFIKGADGYRIEIVNLKNEALDAFSVLSEGHLRVLGLSLLLAMAEKNKLPVIVFDDVVNAIDSDHRANIIDLFFVDEYLKKVQMVVTTHDRLFWERFCIIADKDTYADQNSSRVLTYTNKGVVAIDYAGGFRSKIAYALSVFDVRQALIYCRIWFESLVVEFCLEKKIEITAKFEKSQIKKNNLLQISLEKTFSLVEPHLAYDASSFDLVKNNLINWSGQNQEHHAFDEFGFNFVHSKSSTEVTAVFDAICRVECQLFLDAKRKVCEQTLVDVNQRIARGTARLAGMARAPLEIQEEVRHRLEELTIQAVRVQEELDFIAICTQAQAAA